MVLARSVANLAASTGAGGSLEGAGVTLRVSPSLVPELTPVGAMPGAVDGALGVCSVSVGTVGVGACVAGGDDSGGSGGGC